MKYVIYLVFILLSCDLIGHNLLRSYGNKNNGFKITVLYSDDRIKDADADFFLRNDTSGVYLNFKIDNVPDELITNVKISVIIRIIFMNSLRVFQNKPTHFHQLKQSEKNEVNGLSFRILPI